MPPSSCGWCALIGERAPPASTDEQLLDAAAELSQVAAVLQRACEDAGRGVERIEAARRLWRCERERHAELRGVLAEQTAQLDVARCELEDLQRHADAQQRADRAIKAAKQRAARDLGGIGNPRVGGMRVAHSGGAAPSAAPAATAPPPATDDESVYTWFSAPQEVTPVRAPSAPAAGPTGAKPPTTRTAPTHRASGGRGARRGGDGGRAAPGRGGPRSGSRGAGVRAPSASKAVPKAGARPSAAVAPAKGYHGPRGDTAAATGGNPAADASMVSDSTCAGVGDAEVAQGEATVAKLEAAVGAAEAELEEIEKHGIAARLAARYAKLKRSGALGPASTTAPHTPAEEREGEGVAKGGDASDTLWRDVNARLRGMRETAYAAAMTANDGRVVGVRAAASAYAGQAAGSATEMLQLIDEYQSVADAGGGGAGREVWEVLLSLWYSTDWFLTAVSEAEQTSVLRAEMEWVRAVVAQWAGDGTDTAVGAAAADGDAFVGEYLDGIPAFEPASDSESGDADCRCDDADGDGAVDAPAAPLDIATHAAAAAPAALRHAEECVLRPVLSALGMQDPVPWGTSPADDFERLALLRLGSAVLMNKSLFLPPVVRA